MSKKKTAKKASVVKNVPKGPARISDIVSARKLVAFAAIELAAAKITSKEANEKYNASIGRLLRVIDNNQELPLFDAKRPTKKVKPSKKKKRGGLTPSK